MQGIFSENNLSGFPSTIYYNKFIQTHNECEGDDEGLIKDILKIYNSINDTSFLKNIVDAICYMPHHFKKTGNASELFDYFYYWFGNMIVDKVSNDEEFNSIMFLLKPLINMALRENKYRSPNFYISRVKFRNMKIIFDYSKDYGSIQHALSDNNNKCFSKHNEYIEKAVSTYDLVHKACIMNENTSYCNVYKKSFPNYKNDKKLNTLKCDVNEENPMAHDTREDHALTQGFREANSLPIEIPLPDSKNVNNISFARWYSLFLFFMGISIVFPLLYKFTSVGTWTNKLLRDSGMLFSKIKDKEKNILRKGFYEPDQLNSYNNYFNILYRHE
ncbi:variable surface protein [Plasmodium gonderi]|uniref:Variable surface protein n=1 Tax=Plasmodium gonderi TaxID=77519 RepID=A0A1Y1JN28_PLAGO|nr:variable surface protein [Plasmodium gonderi]GAW83996.1 variable surface protein [Plasmodium gonderi]